MITWTSDYNSFSPVSTTPPFHLMVIIYRSFNFIETLEIQIVSVLSNFSVHLLLNFCQRALSVLWLRLSETFSQIISCKETSNVLSNFSSTSHYQLCTKKNCWDPSKLPLIPSGMLLCTRSWRTTKEWVFGFGINKNKHFSFLIIGLGCIQKGLSLGFFSWLLFLIKSQVLAAPCLGA